MGVLPEFFSVHKKFKKVGIDPAGKTLTLEVDEGVRVTPAEIQESLDKANELSKEAGTDVTFALNRKELKFSSKENKVIVPLDPCDDRQALKDAFAVAHVRESNGGLLLEVVLEAGATMTLAEAETALEKVKGASIKLSALTIRADGTLGIE